MSPEQSESAEDQALLQGLRTALRSGEPLEFLTGVSGLLAVTTRADTTGSGVVYFDRASSS